MCSCTRVVCCERADTLSREARAVWMEAPGFSLHILAKSAQTKREILIISLSINQSNEQSASGGHTDGDSRNLFFSCHAVGSLLHQRD